MQEITVDMHAIELLENYGLDDYAGARIKLQKFFQNYRNREKNDPLRFWAERLIKSHERYCRNIRDDLLIRQHNSFVMKYVYGYSTKDIARKQILNIRSVYKDIGAVLENMMIKVNGRIMNPVSSSGNIETYNIYSYCLAGISDDLPGGIGSLTVKGDAMYYAMCSLYDAPQKKKPHRPPHLAGYEY